MKFIIRDDDVNYHYHVDDLKRWYSGILDVCPISICIPAYVKGDFFHWCDVFESQTQYNLQEWLRDNKEYKIGDNKLLTDYIKELLSKGNASVSMHGITHRNEEMDLLEVKGNNIRGAEFFTNKDYTQELKEAKDYLNKLFGIEINSFTPPHNMLNDNGLKAVIANNLSVCADLINLKKVRQCVQTYGLFNTTRIYANRIITRELYPYNIKHKIGFVFHKRLQPQLDISSIKKTLDFVYKKDGVFVLSTHSYRFDMKMTQYNMTMKDALMDILAYAKAYSDIEYITLHDLFKG